MPGQRKTQLSQSSAWMLGYRACQGTYKCSYQLPQALLQPLIIQALFVIAAKTQPWLSSSQRVNKANEIHSTTPQLRFSLHSWSSYQQALTFMPASSSDWMAAGTPSCSLSSMAVTPTNSRSASISTARAAKASSLLSSCAAASW